MSSESATDPGTAAARHWKSTDTEVRVLQTVQATAGAVPAATTIARGMSHFGEHALGWIAIGAAGALAGSGRAWRSVRSVPTRRPS